MSSIYTGANVYHASATIPSDGDDETAASVDAPLEAALDNTAYLRARVGSFWLVTKGQMPQVFTSSYKGWGALAAYNTTGLSETASAGPVYLGAVGGLLPGDTVELIGSFSMTYNTAVAAAFTRLEGLENASVGNPAGTTAAVPSSEKVFSQSVSGVADINLIGTWTVTTGAVLSVYQNGFVNTTASAANWAPAFTSGVGFGNLVYKVWRPT